LKRLALKFALETRNAFTLVELLVVIAVVGLLIALLIPALSSARSTVASAVCKSNLRQIGLSMQTYAESHRGQFPWTEHHDEEGSWIVTLSPYLDQVDAVRVCPEDPRGKEWMSGEQKGTSYAINNFVADPEVDGYQGSMRKIHDKSRLMVLFEAEPDRDGGHGSDHIHCSQFYSPVYVMLGKVFEMGFREIDTDRHGGNASNYLFADGRVVSIDETSIKEMIDVDLEAGTNFAHPEQTHAVKIQN